MLGWEMTSSAWDDALQRALADPPGTWVVQERIAVAAKCFPQFDADGHGHDARHAGRRGALPLPRPHGRLSDAPQRHRPRQRDIRRRAGARLRRRRPGDVVRSAHLPSQNLRFRCGDERAPCYPAPRSGRACCSPPKENRWPRPRRRLRPPGRLPRRRPRPRAPRRPRRKQGRQEDRTEAERGVHEAGHAERRIWRKSSAPSRFRAPRSPRSSGPTSRRTACRTPRTSA